MTSEERLGLVTVSTPSSGFPPQLEAWTTFWNNMISRCIWCPYVDRLMQCVLSLCMWSVYGLCCVRHKIGHQWRSRRVPCRHNPPSLQFMIWMHVSVNAYADTGWNLSESWLFNFFAVECFMDWFRWTESVEEECDFSFFSWSCPECTHYFWHHDDLLNYAWDRICLSVIVRGADNQWRTSSDVDSCHIISVMDGFSDLSHMCSQQQWD